MQELPMRWERLRAQRGATPDAAAAMFAEIEAMYAHPPRAYHNLDHIAACLAAADALAEGTPLDWRLELAIWLHDCIYEPMAPGNEERSAQVGRKVAERLRGAADDAAAVQRLILATKHGAAANVGERRAIELAGAIVDADLSILAAAPADYDAYAAAIRAEYVAVGEDRYRAGRRQFVESMLARPAIFTTGRGRSLWEPAARANLARELRQLN